MGARHPDRIPIKEWHAAGRTVAQMRERRWDVLSKCLACGLMMQVDLGLVIRVAGPDVSLWDRRQRCRCLGCEGDTVFLGRPPNVTLHMRLETAQR